MQPSAHHSAVGHEAFIVAATRTPVGRAFKGSLVDVRADDLTALVVEAAFAQIPQLPRTDIEDLMVGCGLPGGEQGYNLARVVAVLLGLNHLPGTTVTRYCSSSLQTIRMAAHAIKSGEGDAFVAAGVEMTSRFNRGTSDGPRDTRNPRFDEAMARSAERAKGGGGRWTPATGLPDIYIAMGQTAENVAEIEDVSREEMDRFACLSQSRAVAAQESGFFADEITPVTLPDGRVVSADDGPRPGTTLDVLASLKPAFRPDGRVTAGNSCPLNDGAAAVVVVSDRKARDLGLVPLARIVSSGVSALDPEIMGLGPVDACRQALRRAGMTIDDVDLVELNEAFAAQVIPCARKLDISWEKLNIRGGAIALGHPFGMTGARIMTTLLHNLAVEDKTIGLETMCVGGGQGMAMIVERLT